jgi:hypothetical protein
MTTLSIGAAAAAVQASSYVGGSKLVRTFIHGVSSGLDAIVRPASEGQCWNSITATPIAGVLRGENRVAAPRFKEFPL